MTTLSVLAFSIAVVLDSQFVIKEILLILLIAFFMYSYYQVKLSTSLLFALFYMGLVLIIDYVVYAVIGTLYTSIDVMQQSYILQGQLMMAFGKSILFLCVLIIKKIFGKKLTEQMSDSGWARFFCFPLFTVAVVMAMLVTFQYVENEGQAMVLYTIAFGMVVMNIFVYYLINDVVKREALLHEKEMYELQATNQLDMYKSISANFEVQKKQAHEFKNHVLCIEALTKRQDYAELEKYVTDISTNITQKADVINTNHAIVNAVLNTKYQEATEKQMLFIFNVCDLSGIQMENEDIVVLLANLLNNAIEACEQCLEKKMIKVKFLREEDELTITVNNTFEKKVIYEGNEIKTSKLQNKEAHGVGIKNIIRVVEKYNGDYMIHTPKGNFEFIITIPQ